MFLHSGASLHGHEFTTPHHSPLQRKRPFLRSALPAPILRSSTTSETHSPPQLSAARRRPVSEAHVRPVSDLLMDDPPRARPSLPTSPVVRFKDVDVVDTPKSSSTTEDEPSSFYDSDASQASASTPRRRRRRAAPRKSTAYLVALPAPKLATKKTLFKTIRPRLLLQLQELAANQRPRPTIDVFPASLIAGPLVKARYIHRFPRLFGVKGELGPPDLILVKSEDYTADVEEGDENSNGRRQPVAVLSPGRGQVGTSEIVLEDGSIWTCSRHKSYYSFVHVDKCGMSLTARWVRRTPANRASSAPVSRAGSPATSSAPLPASGDSAGSDYRYTFSIINPLSRRHPILATLSPQSLEIYDDYTTPSSSSGRYPPTRPVSGALDSMSSRDPPQSPLSIDEPSVQRETHQVDANTKRLIMVTGLWLALQLGPVLGCTETGDPASCSQENPMNTQSSTFSVNLPRRQTLNTASNTPPPAQPKGGLKRAMTTSAAFIQRRRQKEPPEARSSITIEMGKMAGMDSRNDDGAVAVAATATATVASCSVQKQARRVSWFKRLAQ